MDQHGLTQSRKAEAPCPRKNAVQFFPGATGIRRAGMKVAF
jgi:hypothetical protein